MNLIVEMAVWTTVHWSYDHAGRTRPPTTVSCNYYSISTIGISPSVIVRYSTWKQQQQRMNVMEISRALEMLSEVCAGQEPRNH